MDWAPLFLALAAGAALGGALAWLARGARTATAIARLEADLEHEKKGAAERLSLLGEAEARFREAFEALSSKALKDNRQEFLDLAQRSLLAPMRESLDKVDAQVQQMEQVRQQAYGSLSEQVRSLIETQQRLHQETGNLVQALRAPGVRGHWGEIQLRRVVEIAGMLPHCDFVEQESVATEDGRLRPDMVVKLPGEKSVVVDAKAPLKAILEGFESATEEEVRSRRVEVVRLVRGHMSRLSSKAYWDQFSDAPDFVLMFIPSESLYMLALEQDFSIVQEGVDQRVILASPLTLITMLKAIAYGWRQERLAENAIRISELGRELHDRIATMASSFADVGKGLTRAVSSYNRAVGSLESRVLPSARRFSEMGIASGEMPALESVETAPRELRAPELAERDRGRGDGLPEGAED